MARSNIVTITVSEKPVEQSEVVFNAYYIEAGSRRSLSVKITVNGNNYTTPVTLTFPMNSDITINAPEKISENSTFYEFTSLTLDAAEQVYNLPYTFKTSRSHHIVTLQYTKHKLVTVTLRAVDDSGNELYLPLIDYIKLTDGTVYENQSTPFKITRTDFINFDSVKYKDQYITSEYDPITGGYREVIYNLININPAIPTWSPIHEDSTYTATYKKEVGGLE